MFIKQMYTNCLAHAAYYIQSGNEAAVIDPLRDPAPYIQLAKEHGAHIKYVIETHFHADFVSGHIDLADKTGATIVFGPGATPAYKAYIAGDAEQLHLGDIVLRILHTPGHTIESICCLAYDEHKKESAVFTGDTLFVGEVGRPDLLSGNLGKEQLAAMLFDSLQNKIQTLPDDVIVYPGHGAGSACGKNIGKESFSTVGEQKQNNYALLIADKDEFIKAVTSDLPIAPAYFFKDAAINKTGYEAFDTIMAKSYNALSVEAFRNMILPGAIVLDTRDPMDFASGFIKGALNIGLNGDFAVWVGTLIDTDASILLVTDPGKEKEAIERLARVGYEKVLGYLDGGMRPWFAEGHHYDRILTFNGDECISLLQTEEYSLLDVRNRGEVAKNRMIGSVHIPLSMLHQKYDTLGHDRKWLIYCAGGYRSMIAASFLKAHGFHFVASVEGGIRRIIEEAPQLIEMDME